MCEINIHQRTGKAALYLYNCNYVFLRRSNTPKSGNGLVQFVKLMGWSSIDKIVTCCRLHTLNRYIVSSVIIFFSERGKQNSLSLIWALSTYNKNTVFHVAVQLSSCITDRCFRLVCASLHRKMRHRHLTCTSGNLWLPSIARPLEFQLIVKWKCALDTLTFLHLFSGCPSRFSWSTCTCTMLSFLAVNCFRLCKSKKSGTLT